jgi:hypothetical protein
MDCPFLSSRAVFHINLYNLRPLFDPWFQALDVALAFVISFQNFCDAFAARFKRLKVAILLVYVICVGSRQINRVWSLSSGTKCGDLHDLSLVKNESWEILASNPNQSC